MMATILDRPLAKVLKVLRKQQTDDALYEAKSCGAGLHQSVWESVSAFANTHGGYLLLGLSEKNNFTRAKGFDFERVLNQFYVGIGDGGVTGIKLVNPPAYEVERGNVAGGQILIVRIEENSPGQKPCYLRAKGMLAGSYKRVDDKDTRFSPVEIQALREVLKPSHADHETVPGATVEDLDPRLISGIVAAHASAHPFHGTRKTTKKLARLNILNNDGNVRMAGLLVAGYYPQQFFPQLFVDVVSHSGLRKDEAEPFGRPDAAVCEGPVEQMVATAVEETARRLRTRPDATTAGQAGRQTDPEIPREVLGEAIRNAVVHREYSETFRNTPVCVDIYPDRVEITSPGGLWGGARRWRPSRTGRPPAATSCSCSSCAPGRATAARCTGRAPGWCSSTPR